MNVRKLVESHLNQQSKDALTVATMNCARDPDKEFAVLVRKTALLAYALAGDDRGVRRAVLAKRALGPRDYQRFRVQIKRPSALYSAHLRGRVFEATIPNTDHLYFELRSSDCVLSFKWADYWPGMGWVVSVPTARHPRSAYKPHLSKKVRDVIRRELRAAHMARPRDHLDDENEWLEGSNGTRSTRGKRVAAGVYFNL